MAKILILEPDESAAAGLSDAIHRAGLSTVVVREAEGAVEAFRREEPALVILDLGIQEGQGLTICHAIRETEGGELVPILLIGTGEEGVKNFGDALAEGGDYYFAKPLDLHKVVSKIRTYVGVDREATTQVAEPPASLEPPEEREAAQDLAGRMEQLMGLGAAFKEGHLEPPGEAPDDRSEQLGEQLFGDQDAETEEPEEPSGDVTLKVQLPDPADADESAELLPPAGQLEEREDEDQAVFPEQVDKIDAGGVFLKEPAAGLGQEAPAEDDKEAVLSRIAGELAQMRRVEKEEVDELAEEAEAWSEIEETLVEAPAGEREDEAAEEEAAEEPDEEADLDAEEQAEREAEEQAEREAEEQAEREAEEQAKREAEEQAEREAEEQAEREAEKQAKREAEEQAKREAEEQAEREAEEQAKREAEEQAEREAEEQAKREAEEQAKREAEEQAKREAEEQAEREAEEQAEREAEKKAKREAEEQAKREAEEKARRRRLKAEEMARRETEERTILELAEFRKRREAEEQARREAEEKARREAEERTKREAEEKTKREAEEKTKREAEEKTRRETEEKTRRETEEKARRETEARDRKEREEKRRAKVQELVRREADERALRELKDKRARLDAEEKARFELDEKRKLEAEERERREAGDKRRREEEKQETEAKQPRVEQPIREVAREDGESTDVDKELPLVGLDEGYIPLDDEEPLEAESVWGDAAEEADGAVAEMADMASAWMEQRMDQDQVDVGEGTEAVQLDAASDDEELHEPTSTGGTDLVQLLEQEASLAREQAAGEAEPTPEDTRGTIPGLPPRPGEETEARKPIREVLRGEAAIDEEGFPEEKTEDLRPASVELVRSGEADEEFKEEDTSPIRVDRRGLRRAYVPVPVTEADAGTADQVEEDAPEAAVIDLGEPPSFLAPTPLSSDLAKEHLPAVLWRFHCQEVTGAAGFHSRGDAKEVYFEAGIPVGVKSSQTVDRLEEVLFREGLIDRAAYAEARIKGIDQPRALAAHLVERGLLRPDELFPLVRRHLEDCLLGLFEWTEGEITFAEAYALESEKVRLARPIPSLILEGIRRKYLLERMVEELGSPASLLAPVPAEDKSPRTPDVADLGFLKEEREILQLVNGMRPIEEIVFLSGRDATTVYRVLLAGVVTGLLAVAVRGVRMGVGDNVAADRDIEIRRRRAEAKFEQINHASYFEILGVAAEATPYEIENAYRRLSREFHPVHFAQAELNDLQDKLDAVRRTLEEARDVLSDDLLREGYRTSLK